MKEIKFRAWIGDRNSLKDVVTYIKHKNGFSITYLDSLGNEIEPMNNFSHKIELMQYTGLKDISGTEVFEGDIIAIRDTLDKYTWLSEVRYKESSFMCNSKECDYFDFPLDGIASDEKHKGSHFCKVIGNIYENGDLLK